MLLWLAVSIFFRIQLPIIAIVFGFAVAGSASHFSGGRHGFRIQLIVSVLTLIGIILADSTSMVCVTILDNPDLYFSDLSLTAIRSELSYRAVNDPFTALFYSLGVLGSLFIWRK